VVEPADARRAVHVSAGAASASAPRAPPASSQASAGVAAEPAPALSPLLRAVRLRVLGVEHGLKAVSVARRACQRGARRVSARRNEAARGDEDACEIWWTGHGRERTTRR
jgi:hypothetical protein